MFNRKMIKRILILLTALVVLLILGTLYYKFSISRLNYSSGKNDASVVDFVIKPGEKVYEIAEHLRQAKLINSAALFKIYVKLNDFSGRLQAGSYKIAGNLSLVEAVNLLQHGTFDARLTFPEGWRTEEMVEYLSQTFRLNNQNFRVADFLNQSKYLEGYLFPDTYVVPFDIKTSELISLMTSNFDKRVDNKMRSDLERSGLSLKDAVTLASIIERESNNDKDRPVIAGILLKRLKSGWPLETDATIQYALASINRKEGEDWWPKELSAADLTVDSPYNTRKNQGLPPGPISNPGLLSIKAVVYSLETPYWFYLTDKNGVTHYAKTLQEHEDNISKFLSR